jgi:hypothetical protein
MLMFISGVSTSGKTTIGKELVKQRTEIGEDWVFKDLDDFYFDKKPIIKLSNGKEKENWDCFEAIDYGKLNEWLEKQIKGHNVFLVGFALSKEYIRLPCNLHFHLTLVDYDHHGFDEKEVTHLVAQNRQLTKGFKGDKAQDDVLMVKEVLIPFYKKIFEELDVFTIVIRVTLPEGGRKPLKGLVLYLGSVVDTLKLPKTLLDNPLQESQQWLEELLSSQSDLEQRMDEIEAKEVLATQGHADYAEYTRLCESIPDIWKRQKDVNSEIFSVKQYIRKFT